MDISEKYILTYNQGTQRFVIWERVRDGEAVLFVEDFTIAQAGEAACRVRDLNIEWDRPE